MEHDGCKGCKYENCSPESKECMGCKQNAVDKYIRITNADRIRSMSDEELSKFIGKFLESMSDCENCPAKTETFLCVDCADEILDWLRKEVEE